MACQPRLFAELDNEESHPSNDYVTPELFGQLKEALLCPVCYDVFRQPV
jgi:hypothetical protein